MKSYGQGTNRNSLCCIDQTTGTWHSYTYEQEETSETTPAPDKAARNAPRANNISKAAEAKHARMLHRCRTNGVSVFLFNTKVRNHTHVSEEGVAAC